MTGHVLIVQNDQTVQIVYEFTQDFSNNGLNVMNSLNDLNDLTT
jgi:hypothetical protein